MKTYKILLLIPVLSVLFSTCTNSKRDINPKELIGGFELLSSEKTGIDFNNSITESKYFNHFFYGHIYNGSGVAIGDINNDGLPDVFFVILAILS